jgi:hypothetical protein
MRHLPTEVWRLITSTLSPFDRRQFIQTHRDAQKTFTTDELRDISFWNKIFIDNVWANKVISHGLYPAVIGNINKKDPYLILILISEGPNADAEQSSTHADDLLKSLRSKLYSLEKHEVEFKHCILHVGEIFEGSKAAIDVTDPKELYREKDGKAIINIKYYVDTSPTTLYDIQPMAATENLVCIKIPRFNHPTRVYYKRRKQDGALRRALGRPLG